MHTIIHNSIHEIKPSEWNAIVGQDRLICRHEFLRAVEASNINDCRFFYPVVYSETGIRAHTCLYTITTDLDSFARGAARRIVNALRRPFPGFLRIRSLECGTPVALGHTFSFREGSPQNEIVCELLDAMNRLAHTQQVGVLLIRDFNPEQAPAFRFLQNLGFHRIHNLPYADMDIEWTSFDEYLQALRSPYRYKVQSWKKRFSDAGGRMLLLPRFADAAETLEKLWMNTYDRAVEYRRERLTAEFFRQCDIQLAERSSVIMALQGDKPVGFLLLLHDDQTLIPLFCGLDYTGHRSSGVYFNLFYQAIETAIAWRKKHIDWGITTMEPKTEIGAKVLPLEMYMKAFDSLRDALYPRLFSWMTPVTPPTGKKVFKS